MSLIEIFIKTVEFYLVKYETTSCIPRSVKNNK